MTKTTTKMKEIFEAKYLEKYEQPFYWDAANAMNCKQLANKIRHTLKAYGKDDDDDSVVHAMLVMMEVNDQWYQDNMSMKILNSKFNEILNKLKNDKPRFNGHKLDQDKLKAAIIRQAGGQGSQPS